MSIRLALSSLAIAFAIYQAARGLLWLPEGPDVVWLLVVLLLAYLCVAAVSLLAVPGRGADDERAPREPMPWWAAVVVLAFAVVAPTATALAAGPDGVTRTYATWYIGGLGALLVVVMVRRRAVFAWIGVGLLTAGAMAWMGPVQALSLGLVGSIVWVGVAHLVVVLILRAERDAAELGEIQAMATAWEAAQEARERERRVQLQRALAVGGPVLSRVIAMHGALTVDERREAGIAEARLRDELRGPRLLDDGVRAAIDAARRRGSQVSVFDEGGLDGLDDEELADVRGQLAAALQDVRSDRIIIRTSPHERVIVTVVGRVRGDGEESVDLWVEIERPAARR